MKPSQKRNRLVTVIIGSLSVLILFVILLAASPNTRRKSVIVLASLQAHLTLPANNQYPQIDTTKLSQTQKKIIDITRAEYNKKPISFDQNVLTYTQGNSEPWCADFATWVLYKAGVPISNPNSRSWRIPGVLTLQSYYQAQQRYKEVNTYTPKPGDIAIYIGERTLDGRNRQHTNIVLKVEEDIMTTIGGNERGRMRVSTQSHKSNDNGLVGFGVLDK